MMKKRKKLLIGVVTGFANGLFGSGGGTIVVPAGVLGYVEITDTTSRRVGFIAG